MVRWRRVAVAVVVIASTVFLWARFIEPRWLEVTHHEVNAPVAAPLKIAHVSDLHSRGIGSLEQSLLDALADEKPDVIVVSGDCVAEDGRPDAVLAKLSAPLGVFIVNGNHEHWHAYAPPDVLVNAARRVRDDVWIVGLDDAMAAPSLEKALSSVPPGVFRIGLFHSPQLFDEVASALPLSFAGHTHGGQVRLPLLPPLWLPRGSGAYAAGWYTRGASRLYVSRGLGTTILPLRFFARPELAIVTVGP